MSDEALLLAEVERLKAENAALHVFALALSEKLYITSTELTRIAEQWDAASRIARLMVTHPGSLDTLLERLGSDDLVEG